MPAYPTNHAGRFPRARRVTNPIAIPALTLACLAGSSCVGGAAGRAVSVVPTRGLDAADRAVGPGGPRPAAVIDGEPVGWSELTPSLAEAAGRDVLNELALERRLVRRCAERGISVTPAMIERERVLLTESLGESSASDTPLSGDALVDRVRRERALGPARYGALLRRNAMLRALVAPDVVLSEGALATAYQRRYGDSYRARVILTRGRADADIAARRLGDGEEFSRVAAEVSTDPSASRGGVIGAVRAGDPRYPTAVLDALGAMKPGGVSPVIPVSTGFVIVRLDGVDSGLARPPMDSVRDTLARDARRYQERLLMEQLAERLLGEPGIKVVDPSLRWSRDAAP